MPPAVPCSKDAAHTQPRARDLRRAASGVIAGLPRSTTKSAQPRLAEHSDIPSLVQLNANAIRSLGRSGLFMPMAEDFFEGVIAEGFVLLLESDGAVSGYSVAVPHCDLHPAFIPFADGARVGLLFGTALECSLRGHGWHPLLIDMRRDIYIRSGYTEIQSTVSPYNTASLRNLVRAGLQVMGLKLLLDGHPRFLLRKVFGQCVHGGKVRTLSFPASGNLDEHESLLKEGLEAVEVVGEREDELVYAEHLRRGFEEEARTP